MTAHETMAVETFAEVFSDHDRLPSVHENMKARLIAAGLDPQLAQSCVIYHPDRGVFVCVVTAFPDSTSTKH